MRHTIQPRPEGRIRPGPDRLETLQLLRAVAVMFVVVSHASHELAGLLSDRVARFDEKLFPGDFGVDLFFVASGFIMVYVSRDVFGAAGAAGDFIRRRIIRIVPLYWAMTSLMIAVVVILPTIVDTATSDPVHWLASYFFIPYSRVSDGMIRPVLGLGWSLQYEMLFYGLFAIGLLLPMRRAVPAIIAMLGLVWVAGNRFSDRATIAEFSAHPIIFEFAAGMLTGWLFVAGARLPRLLCIGLAAAGAALLVLAPRFDGAVDLSRHIYYGIPALLIVSAAILFRGVENSRVHPLLVEAGEASYSTYLTHPFVLGFMALVAHLLDLPSQMAPQAFAAAFVVAALIGAAISGFVVHRMVDTKLTALVRKMLPKGPPVRARVVPAGLNAG